jgi:hypothetical protein
MTDAYAKTFDVQLFNTVHNNISKSKKANKAIKIMQNALQATNY